jgi:hypothetical protein
MGSNHLYFFENNPKEQLFDWAPQLKLFRVCRSPGGMLDTVPDMFVARTSFPQLKHAEDFLRSLGLEPESPSGILNGIPFSLYRASRDDWDDVWFQVSTGSDCSAPLTTLDFERASELEIFLLTLPSLKWIDPPWDTERCICPKYYPEVFEKSGRY